MVIAFGDVAVSVKDAQASARWWEENLDFRTFTLGGEGHAVMVAPPGDRFLMHLCEGFEPVEPGNTGIAFVTDDLMPLAKRMEERGVRFPEPAKKTEWGASAKFEDPDGNVFWLVEGPRGLIRQTMEMRAPAAKRSPAKKGAKRASKAGGRKSAAKKAAKRRAR